jgi:hypothetical protein
MKLRLSAAVWSLCIVFALSGAACTETSSGTSSPASSPLAVGGGSLSSATAIPVATPTPTRAPTPPPTPAPTPKPATPAPVVATPAPAPPAPPAANTCGAPSNPWGYNFCGGNYIYSPPGTFCSYFSCIPSFWKSTNGYVEQCVDGMFSHSGGRQGSCSYHGGNQRPLYGP